MNAKTKPNETADRAIAANPASEFRARSTLIATSLLRDWVGEERAREASGRLATALAASAAAARNPQDFYDCTPGSVAKVIAISALTGIMVSTGQAALAYAIPRRPRKGEQPQLQYQLSHRGLAALAKRAGLSLVAYPISYRDEIEADNAGEVIVVNRDFDDPPMTEDDLRGVMVLVRLNMTGAILSRAFVAKKLINERRAKSDSYNYAETKGGYAKDTDPWHQWYVPMAIKTAMHYAIARGWCVIDDTEAVRALSADMEGDCQVEVGMPETRNRSRVGHSPLNDSPKESEPPHMTPEEQQDAEFAEASAKEQRKGGDAS